MNQEQEEQAAAAAASGPVNNPLRMQPVEAEVVRLCNTVVDSETATCTCSVPGITACTPSCVSKTLMIDGHFSLPRGVYSKAPHFARLPAGRVGPVHRPIGSLIISSSENRVAACIFRVSLCSLL